MAPACTLLPRVRLTVCGSAVKLTATTTGGAPGARRIQLSTLLLAVSSVVSKQTAKAGLVFLSWIRFRYQPSNELGSAFSACTLMVFALGGTGSHGLALALEKPALAVASHCMGVRSPSRPLSLGHPVMPTGSFTSSLRVGGVVFIPISSP